MSNTRLEVPKHLRITIRDFVANYVQGPTYRDKTALTHTRLIEYLQSHQCSLPKRLSLKTITKEDLCTARVLFVYDVKGRMVPYQNPYYKDPQDLLRELQKTSEKELAHRREMMKREAYRETLLQELREQRKILAEQSRIFYESMQNKPEPFSSLEHTKGKQRINLYRIKQPQGRIKTYQ